ncbi:MAG TPA: xylulokinase [Chthoniobacterales bacterium]|nr:xylulokinase [Chthoniobacterales bacterium]
MLCLGIDSGTQSTKALLLDIDSGEVLAQAEQSYGMIEGLPPGHMEQDPQTWVEAAETAVAECLKKIGKRSREICALGVSGQQHGLVALDDAGDPLRPAKLWCDISTETQCEELNKEFGGAEGLIERIGNPILPGYTAPKLLWLKENEPASFRRLTSILLPHDYLNLWLTGERQMEYGDASGTGLMDVRTRKWSQPILKFIDPDLESMLPPLRSSKRPAGLLRSVLREKWSLADDALVSAGSGDNMLSAIGTGNIRAGVVTISLGTSGTICAYADEPVIDPKGEVAAFCDATDHWLPLTCTMNLGGATEQMRELLSWDRPTMEQRVAAAPAGAGGILFLPYLQGERTPNLPKASGVFHGLTTENMTPDCMARAAVEGVTLGLAYGLRRFKDLGIVPEEIRLTGGGSKSAAWRQIAADILGFPTIALRVTEGAALGAAIQAAWTYCQVKGKPLSLEELVDELVVVEKKTRVEPAKNSSELYGELLLRRIDLTKKLKTAGYL